MDVGGVWGIGDDAAVRSGVASGERGEVAVRYGVRVGADDGNGVAAVGSVARGAGVDVQLAVRSAVGVGALTGQAIAQSPTAAVRATTAVARAAHEATVRRT